MNNKIPQEILSQMFKNRLVRKEITSKSFWYFILFYFGNYITYTPAPFHYEIFSLIENESIENLIIQAFRGSGKTTIINQFYPIWAILGKQKKKHIVIVGQTLVQAKLHLKNIKTEFESNQLLRNDLGPFQEDEEWNSYSLIIPKHNARITATSSEQSIRGSKHGQFRPDLIILDDIEDTNSVKTRDSRDNTYRWIISDIFPLGDKSTRIIIIGNLLHEDGLLARLINEIDQGTRSGVYRRYPLIDENDCITWPGKYPTMADINKEKMRIGNEVAWQREFLLRIISDDNQIIKREWIRYYDKLPDRDDPKQHYQMGLISVDPGVKENKPSCDPTAIVAGHAFGSGDNLKIYISPEFFNKRVSFLEIVSQAKEMADNLNNGSARSRIVIEEVASQYYIIQQVRKNGYYVDAYRPRGDKSERLRMISPLIQNGQVVFHRSNKEIVDQLVNFGIEKHDDLCDAIVMLVEVLIKNITEKPSPFPKQKLTDDDNFGSITKGFRKMIF